MSRPGGFTEVRDADDDVRNLVNEVKNDFENSTQKTYNTFNAHSYRSQVVAGTNYWVKVHLGGTDYVHLKVYKPLPHVGAPPVVDFYELDKQLESELGPQ